MTDALFNDDDLRAAAALMHYGLTIEPNPADADAALSDNPRWLLVKPGSEQDEQLRESTVELVSRAANISRWAVDLGADGLEAAVHSLTLDAADRPIARVHFAFEPGMPESMRTALVTGIAEEIAKQL